MQGEAVSGPPKPKNFPLRGAKSGGLRPAPRTPRTKKKRYDLLVSIRARQKTILNFSEGL